MGVGISQKIIFIFLIFSIIIFSAGSDFYFFPVAFFIVWLINMIYSVSDGFLIRQIFVLFMALQYFVGPTLSYAFSSSETYNMMVPSKEFFSFAFPSVLLFGAGLYFKTQKSDEDKVFKQLGVATKMLSLNDKFLDGLMIFSLIADFLGFSPPEALSFVFYIIYCLKYAYVCYIIVTKPKINYVLLGLPILFLIVQTLQTAMFHDLVTWSIFWGLAVCMRVKPKVRTVVSAILVFSLFIVIIQISKQAYRAKAWGGETGQNDAGLDSYTEAVQNKTEGGISTDELSENIVRINQGWILARVIDFVPKYTEHEGFDLINKYAEAAFLPRAFAPDKLTAGNKEVFAKYTGLQLQSKTSMGLGILADSWISFGLEGGLFMMFVYGLIMNLFLKYFESLIQKFPLLYFFLPLVFIYPIRPDCETQTSFGHLVKTTFFLTILAYAALTKTRKQQLIPN
jgi:hypothetical protein